MTDLGLSGRHEDLKCRNNHPLSHDFVLIFKKLFISRVVQMKVFFISLHLIDASASEPKTF